MVHQCYYCERIFDSKEQLYEHLNIHATTKEKQPDDKKKSFKEH